MDTVELNSKDEIIFNNTIKSTQSYVFHPRLAWMMYYRDVQSIKKVCEKFGISRKTFYKWWHRYFNSGYKPESLFDHSRKPHNSPLATPTSTVQKILEAKKITGFGVKKLKYYLIENYNIKISEHTIWKILIKNHQNKKIT